MPYKDKNGYNREPSNLIHRHRAYHHIYLKDRKKYPMSFEAYEVHHIDGDKNNNRMDNLAVLTPEQHDKAHEKMKEERECIAIFGLSNEEFNMRMKILEKKYGINYEKFSEDFTKMLEEVQRADLEELFGKKEFKGFSKELIDEKIDEEMEYYPDKEFLLKIWDKLLEKYKEEKKEKEDEERETERKRVRNEKIKTVIKKGFNKLFKKKARVAGKNLYCIDCNRRISHVGRCLACNIKAKRKREAQEKRKWLRKK